MDANPSKPSKRSLVSSLRKLVNEEDALRLLDAPYAVHAADKKGETALHVACELGFVRVASALLDAGADPNARNWRHSTPLLKAISRAKNIALVEMLVARGAEVNSTSLAIASPLVSAIQAGLPDVARVLEKAGADVRRVSAAGTVLHAAVQTRSLAMCEMVLGWPVDLEAENVIGETPLSTAAFIGDVQIATLLVRHGADPMRPGGCQMSPLARAEDVNEFETARAMVSEFERVKARRG